MSQNKTAAEIFKEYKTKALNLTNRWVQLRQQYPLEQFPELAADVRYNSEFAELWGRIAVRLNEMKYWSEK